MMPIPVGTAGRVTTDEIDQVRGVYREYAKRGRAVRGRRPTILAIVPWSTTPADRTSSATSQTATRYNVANPWGC
jgi:hypothetical protein